MSRNGETPKLAYTVEEASEALSISRAQLYRLMDHGQLGFILIGRSRRITAHQLQTFLEGLEAFAPRVPTPIQLLNQTKHHGQRKQK
jgi:excisionase family DNA binding protein